MEFKETVFSRRSRRFLTDEKIPEDKIEYILSIASRAPVALGLYSNISLLVIEGETLKRLQKKFLELNKIDNTFGAGLLIVVLHKGPKEDLRNQDAGIIGEHICLAATDIGLGSVYLHSIVDMMNKDKFINKELLKVEKPYEVMCGIAIGELSSDTTRDVAHKFQTIRFN